MYEYDWSGVGREIVAKQTNWCLENCSLTITVPCMKFKTNNLEEVEENKQKNFKITLKNMWHLTYANWGNLALFDITKSWKTEAVDKSCVKIYHMVIYIYIYRFSWYSLSYTYMYLNIVDI